MVLLVLLANRVPKAPITFLLALAIADDLGAVLAVVAGAQALSRLLPS